VDWAGVVIALVALLALIEFLHPGFIAPSQLSNLVQQSVYVGILAMAMCFLLSMAEVDLSVGGTYVLAMVTAALLMQGGIPPWIAACMAVVVGAGIGVLNALIVQGLRINSLIATLSMGWVLHGLAAAVTSGKQIVELPLQDSFFEFLGGGEIVGVPVSIWVFLAVGVLLLFLLRRTTFGFRAREIGSNPAAALFSGIPIDRVKIQGFILVSTLAAISGVIGLAYFTTGDPTAGGGFELFAVASAVIGGTPLSGGRASITGAAIAAILLNAVNTALVFASLPATWTQFATGAVILAAVAMDAGIRRRRELSARS
jgi:ribose/xylose/arabinose/galactoside ABC-type transport system permease subunit